MSFILDKESIAKRLDHIGTLMAPAAQTCPDCNGEGCDECFDTGRIEYTYSGDVDEDIKWLYKVAKQQQQQLTPGSPIERAPTLWAYDQACKALDLKTEKLKHSQDGWQDCRFIAAGMRRLANYALDLWEGEDGPLSEKDQEEVKKLLTEISNTTWPFPPEFFLKPGDTLAEEGGQQG